MRKSDKKTKKNEELPDYELWLNKPCWYVNEICCLVKGFDPDHVSGGVVVDLDSGEIEPAPKNYRAIDIVTEVSEMIRRAIESGELKAAVSGGNCFKPLTVITYLNQKGVVLPSELLMFLQRSVAPEEKGITLERANEKKGDTGHADENVSETNKQSKPWLIENPDDPKPKLSWFTPARYFARKLVEDDSTLLTKRNRLSLKVVTSLRNVGIYKRGGKKPFDAETIKKAFTDVNLG